MIYKDLLYIHLLKRASCAGLVVGRVHTHVDIYMYK